MIRDYRDKQGRRTLLAAEECGLLGVVDNA